MVERVERRRSRGDCLVESIARELELAVFHEQLTEFFVVPRRGIVANGELEGLNVLAPRHAFQRMVEQGCVWHDFGKDVDQGADGAKKQDDVEPIGVGTAANEVDDRRSLKEKTPWIEEVCECTHEVGNSCG